VTCWRREDQRGCRPRERPDYARASCTQPDLASLPAPSCVTQIEWAEFPTCGPCGCPDQSSSSHLPMTVPSTTNGGADRLVLRVQRQQPAGAVLLLEFLERELVALGEQGDDALAFVGGLEVGVDEDDRAFGIALQLAARRSHAVAFHPQRIGFVGGVVGDAGNPAVGALLAGAFPAGGLEPGNQRHRVGRAGRKARQFRRYAHDPVDRCGFVGVVLGLADLDRVPGGRAVAAVEPVHVGAVDARQREQADRAQGCAALDLRNAPLFHAGCNLGFFLGQVGVEACRLRSLGYGFHDDI
jgi:hypothetical protein